VQLTAQAVVVAMAEQVVKGEVLLVVLRKMASMAKFSTCTFFNLNP
jgi:hypothetical protein